MINTFALPGEPGGGVRWGPYKKRELLRRLRASELTVDQACARFGFSQAEIDGMIAREQRFGLSGLAVLKLQRLGARG